MGDVDTRGHLADGEIRRHDRLDRSSLARRACYVHPFCSAAGPAVATGAQRLRAPRVRRLGDLLCVNLGCAAAPDARETRGSQAGAGGPAVRAPPRARAVRALRSAAHPVLRRPARPHRPLARRQHPGHARHAGRRLPLRARRGARHPALRRGRARAAPSAPDAAARLRRRHRSRRAVRRADDLRRRPACPATTRCRASSTGTGRGSRSSSSTARSRTASRRSASDFCGPDGARCRERGAHAVAGWCARPPKAPTTAPPRAASPPSSATSGPARRAATTSTAT